MFRRPIVLGLMALHLGNVAQPRPALNSRNVIPDQVPLRIIKEEVFIETIPRGDKSSQHSKQSDALDGTINPGKQLRASISLNSSKSCM